MILDSSAVLAILANEPKRAPMLQVLSDVVPVLMSAATCLEAAIVIDSRRDPVLSRRYDELLNTPDVEIVDVTAAQGRRARDAYLDDGRGSSSPARLNFGDCFSTTSSTPMSGEPSTSPPDPVLEPALLGAGILALVGESSSSTAEPTPRLGVGISGVDAESRWFARPWTGGARVQCALRSRVTSLSR